MNRNDLINSAKELINGDRANIYGDVKINHERIAGGWNIIAQAAVKTHGDLTHQDSWVDKIGYASLGGEMATEEK